MAYTNNPYFLPAQEDQQIAGIAPMMQNIAAQQANQQSALSQANQLAQVAGRPTSSLQSNAMALAGALRKDKKKEEELANKEMAAYNQRPAMEYYSKGLNPMDIVSDQ